MVGYTEENSRSCCGDCNYMKRNNDYDLFIEKSRHIYLNQNINPIHEFGNKSLKNIVTGNKLSQSEKIEHTLIIKRNKKEELREKYANEESKRAWISEIVNKRIEKNTV